MYQATFVGYFPADKPQYTCIVVIRTKPHAASHFGGTLAAPVFREIATKLYARYVENKDPVNYAVIKDSSAFFYAGLAEDIRKVYRQLHVAFTDSTAANNWTNVYAGNTEQQKGQPLMKPVAMRNQVMPNVRGMGLKDALYLLENMGVKVSVKGRGKVSLQSVSPGTQLAKGVTVMLELS